MIENFRRCVFGNEISTRGAPSTRSGLAVGFPSPAAPAAAFFWAALLRKPFIPGSLPKSAICNNAGVRQ